MAGQPVLGLCPVGKFVFSHADAVRQKKALQERLRQWAVRFVDIDGAVPDGLVREESHVEAAVRHLRDAGARCLFLPHCNFGTEGVAGLIARRLGLPVLLWGPRDEAPLPDGTRLRDTLCGTFATSKVLHKLGVPFTYIENCRMDDPPLKTGVELFLRAVNAADVFRRGVRIGHVGQRISFFWTTIINESELLERFNIQIVPLDMVEFIRHVRQRAEEGRIAYLQEAGALRATAQVEEMTDEQLVNVLAVRDQLLALAGDHALDGLAIQDFMSLIDETGAYCSYADSSVADRYAIGYESDIHGAVSDILLRRASLDAEPAFLTDLTIRHPEKDNAVLLWHFGAALSLRDPASRLRLAPHWILPSPLSGMTHFKLKEGPVTIARFDGDGGRYELAVGEGRTTDGPFTLNNYVWMEVDDWPRWRRRLMEGPFIHHVAMAYGHYADALVEATKYVPGLQPVRLDSAER